MAKNKLTRKRDEREINIKDDYAVEYWAQQFGVSKERIINTVQKVGTSAAVVKSNLNNKMIKYGL